MYVSTTSDNSSVGSAVSSPHLSRLFSNVDRFFRLHPSREYLSLSMPAHQKNDHGSKKRLILKECAKIGKVRKKGRERRFSFFFCFFYYSTIRLLTLFTVKQQLLTLLTLQFDIYTYTTIEYYYLLHTYYYYN